MDNLRFSSAPTADSIDASIAQHYPDCEPVAVIGYACHFPESPDGETFWQNLLEGRECSRHFTREASWQQVDAWRQWLSHVTGPVVIDGDHFYPIQQARSFFTQIVRHFPHAFSAMTAWQKQPSTSER